MTPDPATVHLIGRIPPREGGGISQPGTKGLCDVEPVSTTITRNGQDRMTDIDITYTDQTVEWDITYENATTSDIDTLTRTVV